MNENENSISSKNGKYYFFKYFSLLKENNSIFKLSPLTQYSMRLTTLHPTLQNQSKFFFCSIHAIS